ncbi:MAG TPA: sarcosine oxidase subunit gamma family protein [Rhizomicrobium sp.]
MADPVMRATPALAGLVKPGRFGAVRDAPGVRISVRDDLEIASVAVRAGARDAFDARASALLSFIPKDGPVRSGNGNMSALGIGPGRWLFLRRGGQGDFAAGLAADLAPLASVSDQSDGYVSFAVGGDCARRTLAKGMPLDLHPAAFAEDDVAVTLVTHIGAVVWREDEQFHIAVFRSYVGSFWHWLSASAAEFGAGLV